MNLKKNPGLLIIILCILITRCSNKPATAQTSENSLSGISIKNISITPSTATMSPGSNTSLTATAFYSDGTTSDITNLALWVSNDTTIVMVSPNGVASAVTEGSADITASYNDVTSDLAMISVTSAVLKNIYITASAASTAIGLTVTYTATGTYSDSSTGNISGSVTWQSSDLMVATVNESGIATGLCEGTSHISASLLGIDSNAITINVTAAVLSSITVSPAAASVQAGKTLQFVATGTMSDGSVAILDNLIWQSGDNSLATIDSTGLATCISPGSTMIYASLDDVLSNVVELIILLAQVPPIANAGSNQNVTTGSIVQLDGGSSSDANGDSLTYSWSFALIPAGSGATFSDPTIINPTFVADINGTYMINLIVNDGFVDSPISKIMINVFPGCGNSAVVISQIYSAGGNAGATYNKDFIEIHNRSISDVDISSWSVQYSSAVSSTWTATNLSGSIVAGGYLLISLAGGANGSSLPVPDVSGTTNMSATSGKIALVDGQANLSGCPAAVPDLVGYGSANCWEGAAAANSPSATSSLNRNNNGCDDTNGSALDFIVAPAMPKNSLSPVNSCGCL